MPKTTDLDALKDIARTLIYMDFEKTPYYPVILHHPYTESGIVAVKDHTGSRIINLLENKDDLAAWRQMLKGHIQEASNVMDLSFLLTKSYLLSFLELAEKHLSPEDLSQLLRNTWVRVEFVSDNPVFTKAQFSKLFRKCDPAFLMTADERDMLKRLPDEVTIYRGVRKGSKKVKGMSWTTDLKTADFFSRRFMDGHCRGDVYKATIHKSDILACFQERNENEIVVDARRLQRITKLNQRDLEKHLKKPLDQTISDAAELNKVQAMGTKNRISEHDRS